MPVSVSAALPSHCAYLSCSSNQKDFVLLSPGSRRFKPIVRCGGYKRKSCKGGLRFKCHFCKKTFSDSRLTPEFGLRRRDLNPAIYQKLVSGESQRRIALLEGIHLDTVAHRVVFFGHIAEQKLRARLLQRQASQDLIKSVDLDEMESSIHSKLLPVSMPIIVETKSREILWLSVSEMPAKGPMAQASVKKYGKRKDHRKMHGILVLNTIKPAVVESVIVQTDYKRDYPTWIAETLPLAKHQPTKGRRGCVVGQGELKKIGHDPLFSFNHTAAMFRANVNRLFRRTWCTSKRLDRLYLHMMIYAQFHNEVLVPLAEKRRKRRESKRLAAA